VLKPFLSQWYCGVEPPLVGTAVKVTGVPVQIVVGVFGSMLTAGATLGFEVTRSVLAAEDPHTFCATTLTVPPVAPAVALMLKVDDVPLHPAGSVQVYAVAPATGCTLKTRATPEQLAAVPVMGPGVTGTVPTFTASVCAAEVPQVLEAITVMVPAPAPGPAVAVMLEVVEEPVHPGGSVHA
jgi:hypothetical protein